MGQTQEWTFKDCSTSITYTDLQIIKVKLTDAINLSKNKYFKPLSK